MGKFVNIKDNDFESTLCEFLDPDLVYVPYDKSYKLCIKDGDKVCFNDAILKSDSNTIVQLVEKLKVLLRWCVMVNIGLVLL